jgi:glucuronokinase
LHGYYGGIRLVKATIKRFVEYCEARNIALHDRNFSIRYETTIPRQVGLAGSSAIIVATLRCLMEFYDVTIPLAAQPTFVLSVEKEELSIAAGLQDRVIQVHEGLVSMDFGLEEEQVVDGFKSYAYERLDPALLPPLYLAYSDHLSEPTEVFHNDIRGRFDRGDSKVVDAMRVFARLAAQARRALLERNVVRLGELMNENFDLRRTIYDLPAWQVQMVETARACGVSAKFAGSGGAIIGIVPDDGTYETLRARLGEIGSRTIRPRVTE